MKRSVITSLFCCVATIVFAQNITLDECIAAARENYPLIKKYELIQRTESVDLSNIGKSWLPQVGVYAQATIQNDVPAFPESMEYMLEQLGVDMPGLRKDQYKIGVDVNQTIWDGGASSANREVARATAQSQTAATDVELYAVEERVEDLFFAVLLIQSQIEQQELTAALLQSNLDRLRSMFANGTAMQSDVDIVEAESLTVAQNIVRLRGNEQSCLRMLELFVGSSLAGKSLECPQASMPIDLQSNRPELQQFDAELAKNESMRKQINASLMPKIGFFAQAYYGYPGYDYFRSMTSRDWTFNAMAGIKVSWTIGALYTKKNKLSQLTINDSNIETSREVFLFNNNLQSAQQQSEIELQQAVVADDAKIVELRTSVRKAAESRLANGVIDTTDLLAKITDESTASLNAAYHKIELIKTIYKLKHTVNK